MQFFLNPEIIFDAFLKYYFFQVKEEEWQEAIGKIIF